MDEWQKQIQVLILEIDECIRRKEDEALTLSALAKKLGFSEFYVSRKFREVSGMSLREYMRQRSLALALKEVRDTDRGLLAIALDYGFSSHEAFSRAFKKVWSCNPSEFKENPRHFALFPRLYTPVQWEGENFLRKNVDISELYDLAAKLVKISHIRKSLVFFSFSIPLFRCHLSVFHRSRSHRTITAQ